MRRLLSLAEVPREEVLDLLALAARLELRPEPQALAGRVLALLFFNPSLRTLASFQAGMARLGGSSFVISPGQGSWQLETRRGVVMDGDAAEHVREAVPVLAQYADALGIRSFAGGKDLAADLADSSFRAMADVCPVPLINLESAIDHPCQALADWKTMEDLQLPRHGRFVLTWACHPKPLPLAVPAAAVHMAAARGMEVVVARPHGYGLPEPVLARARAAAELSGGSVRETIDPGEAMVGAQVVYAKSWGSPELYGNANAEASRRRALGLWCVDDHWFDEAKSDCRFMHCLPVRRNVVVTDAVLDGPRSVVVHEARNRMWVQMAVLHRMLVGAGRGAQARAGASTAHTPEKAGGMATVATAEELER
ncbi:MAG TPA: N-acetylornithine carbamoyltransferase [Thermoanaerobaculia bacterium]|jgi:N-acetylornithine carbamoyltransferase|nr:N-acetylornithine carbamoyltransferase [Thermoanaerobaculia bacterium]